MNRIEMKVLKEKILKEKREKDMNRHWKKSVEHGKNGTMGYTFKKGPKGENNGEK